MTRPLATVHECEQPISDVICQLLHNAPLRLLVCEWGS